MARTTLTDQGRQKLREEALRRRPWEHSTGPRTAAGKAKVSRNAVKHGYWSREAVQARREGRVVPLAPEPRGRTDLRRMYITRLVRMVRCDDAGDYDPVEVVDEVLRRAMSQRRDAAMARALLFDLAG